MQLTAPHYQGAFDLNSVLFSASFEVQGHVVKKNSRDIHYKWGKGNSFTADGRRFTPFIGKGKGLEAAENLLVLFLQQRAACLCMDSPLSNPLWGVFRFFFPQEVYYTVKNEMSLIIGDQSNLYQAPEDALQKAGVIKSDALIRAHCLSTCLPSNEYRLEIYLLPYEESPAWKLRNSFPQPSPIVGQS